MPSNKPPESLPNQKHAAPVEAKKFTRREGTPLGTGELETELTRENLQFTIEQLKATNKKLQDANRELTSSNKELLHTNEELLSANKELFAANAEFQAKEQDRSELEADERSIISASGIGILFLDENLCVRKYSQPAARLLKLIDQDYGRPFTSISGQIVQDITEDIYNVVSGDRLIEREVEDRDGAVYQMRIHPHMASETDETAIRQQKKRGVILTFSEISKLKSLQKTLERNEQRFGNILNSVSDGYFEWEIGTNDIFISDQCLSRLGYSRCDTLTLDLLMGQHSDEFRRGVQKSCESRNTFSHILPVTRKDRTPVWMLCKGDCSGGVRNESAKFSGILIDVSKYKKVETQLQRKTRDLERSNQLLEQFAHIASHDLKAPLRHSQNYLRFLQEAIDRRDYDKMQEEMNALADNYKRLNTLINDIIKYSRVTSEKKKEELVSINETIDAVVTLIKPGLIDKQVKILYGELPTVQGDKSLLTQLFLNLIDNACKYNDKTTPEIEIACTTNAQDCVISIRDNGIGFNESYGANIFNPFKRLVTRDQYEGSGIGLSICKTVAEQHGGHISASSKPGRGSVFHVTLPINQEDRSNDL